MENVTAERIKELREKNGEKQEDLASVLGIKRQVVSYYESGTRFPNVDIIIELAKHYNVTTDYLLGLSNAKPIDNVVQAVSKYTGLSGDAIKKLHKIKQQADGKYMSEKYKSYIEEEKSQIRHTIEEIDDYEITLYNRLVADVDGFKNQYPTIFDYVNATIEDIILSFTKSNAIEGKSVLDTINYLSEKEDFFDFMLTCYIYLFADVSEVKGVLTGVAVSDTLKGEFCISYDKQLLNESYLLKLNNYLNNWKSRGNVRIVDLETVKDGEQDADNSEA